MLRDAGRAARRALRALRHRHRRRGARRRLPLPAREHRLRRGHRPSRRPRAAPRSSSLPGLDRELDRALRPASRSSARPLASSRPAADRAASSRSARPRSTRRAASSIVFRDLTALRRPRRERAAALARAEHLLRGAGPPRDEQLRVDLRHPGHGDARRRRPRGARPSSACRAGCRRWPRSTAASTARPRPTGIEVAGYLRGNVESFRDALPRPRASRSRPSSRP